MANNPEYDRFEREAAEAIASQQAAVAAWQAQAQRLLEQGSGDVQKGGPAHQ